MFSENEYNPEHCNV